MVQSLAAGGEEFSSRLEPTPNVSPVAEQRLHTGSRTWIVFFFLLLFLTEQSNSKSGMTQLGLGSSLCKIRITKLVLKVSTQPIHGSCEMTRWPRILTQPLGKTNPGHKVPVIFSRASLWEIISADFWSMSGLKVQPRQLAISWPSNPSSSWPHLKNYSV